MDAFSRTEKNEISVEMRRRGPILTSILGKAYEKNKEGQRGLYRGPERLLNDIWILIPFSDGFLLLIGIQINVLRV